MRNHQTLQIMLTREASGGFATALPGRFPGRWVGYPFALLTVVAIGIAIIVEWQRTGGAPWNCIFFYGCTWFFALLYSVAWRTGTVVRRLAAMLVTVVMLLFLAWYHGDQSGVRQDYSAPPGVATSDSLPSAGQLIQIHHPSSPWLAISVAADLLAATALLAHGLYMGWGYRARKVAKGEESPILPRSATRLTQGIRLFESDGTEEAIGDQELIKALPTAAELEEALLERMRSDILNLRAQTGERSAEPSVEPPSGEVWEEVLPPDWVAEEPAEPPTDEASEKS
ncbi:MAG: hypothetical protein HQ461_12160 [Deltaproteobacteria bacterium]|nr:hypothetical protein [Deltaproteobacteria bacterium]